jgi:peroxiredoxin
MTPPLHGCSRLFEVRSMPRVILFVFVFAAGLSLACGGRREASAPEGNAAARPAAKQAGAAPATAPASAPATGETTVGSMMPAYSAQSLDGKSFDLAGERGQVVLLNLWATWCDPCRFEIPQLQKMQGQYAGRGFKVIGVSLDDAGASAVRPFVSEHKMTYPIVLDTEGKLANILQTSVIPTTVLIDRKGKIVWKQLGVIEEGNAELKAALDSALNEKS